MVYKITNYYLTSPLKDGVRREKNKWKTNIPKMTRKNRYLWMYQEITYTDGTVRKTRPYRNGEYHDRWYNKIIDRILKRKTK